MHDSRHNSFLALLVGIAGWVIPGAGHLLLGMWTRALGVFAMVAALAWTGIALRGRLFAFTTDDFFDLLGFLADCGAGSFYYFALKYNNGGPDVAHAAGDYGTRFFAAAGVLNVLAAVDAYRLARGDEQDVEADEASAPEAPSPEPAHDPAAQPAASTTAAGDPASQQLESNASAGTGPAPAPSADTTNQPAAAPAAEPAQSPEAASPSSDAPAPAQEPPRE